MMSDTYLKKVATLHWDQANSKMGLKKKTIVNVMGQKRRLGRFFTKFHEKNFKFKTIT